MEIENLQHLHNLINSNEEAFIRFDLDENVYAEAAFYISLISPLSLANPSYLTWNASIHSFKDYCNQARSSPDGSAQNSGEPWRSEVELF